MKYLNNLGTFDSISSVWKAYPYGGKEGDYVIIGGNKIGWDKYTQRWEEAPIVLLSYPLVTDAPHTTELQPNTFYVFGEASTLNLSLGEAVDGNVSEYVFQFDSGLIPTSLSIDANVRWMEDLVIFPRKTYQVSILDGYATFLEFDTI